MAISLTVNGKPVTLDADPDMPLLWALRDELRLTGTKFGCGIAQCGACTVMLDGMTQRSCVTPIGTLEGADVRTIEALDGPEAEAVKAAWVDINVPQCGYCQSGQVVSATALLREIPKPTDEDIDNAMGGNVCRCATYARIRQAIRQASDSLEG
ncbi:isoquinoline 1-oxidoreductase, alpha subunit [Roseovarius nanhaiticus]|uniref:Isoquinoline 1-oxidoreductase, alpha subunit n=1 Tax=Roseovarius nanhaiticus TaxID=573024 RepID=A0A1N7EM39_9RHOB|nr:(2Fe-2S)-binding protein [Roseovarius nanhaiticus]SEK71578.1 isoquinoline 1-oxidoreductase, alpha subunit [Roseovarius nanhaiticus]SIR89157.1 isoquinoline 1-oxidoreductase, alpha subunit [Roseovarius nanhaiticus]